MSNRWSNHFWVKIHVFSTSFKNKSKSCGYNPAKCLVMCYSSCKAKEITISRSFSLISYKMAAKIATIVGDVTGLQQRHHS